MAKYLDDMSLADLKKLGKGIGKATFTFDQRQKETVFPRWRKRPRNSATRWPTCFRIQSGS